MLMCLYMQWSELPAMSQSSRCVEGLTQHKCCDSAGTHPIAWLGLRLLKCTGLLLHGYASDMEQGSHVNVPAPQLLFLIKRHEMMASNHATQLTPGPIHNADTSSSCNAMYSGMG